MRKLWRDRRGQSVVENLLVTFLVALGSLFVLGILAAAITAALASLDPARDGYMGSKPVSSGPHVPFPGK
jgi:hypothetical protein